MSKSGLCLNCGNPLTGKQQKYCSDRCRKRDERNADNSDKIRAGIPENYSPQGFFGRLSDILSDLDTGSRIELIRNLNAIADYQDVWTKRVLARPSLFPKNALETYQRTEQIFRLIIDYTSNEQNRYSG